MMKYFYLFLLLVLFSMFGQAQILTCLDVEESDGTVLLHFTGPQNTTEYKIYRSNQMNGSFDMIGSAVGGASSSFLDTEISAASQSYSYYIEALVNGQSLGESDKMRTMLLIATNLNNGLVELNWNDPGFSPTSNYQIWRKGNVGIAIQIASTSNIYYIDTLTVCDTVYNYKIVVNTSSCESESNIRGGSFGNHTNPDNVIPKNASVDLETGEIILSWLLPSEENDDIAKYQIWKINSDGGSTTPFAEVDGYDNLSISIPAAEVCDTTITFCVTAMDVCGNSSVYSEPYFIRTLNMRSPVYDICKDECVIKWDSIYPWVDMGVLGVKVFESKGAGDFELVANVPAEQKELVLNGFDRGIRYQFYIESYSEDGERTSTSCIKSIIGKKPETTAYTWLRSASVENGAVQIKWQIEPSVHVPYFAISRSEDGDHYQIIDTVRSNLDTIQTYIDRSSRYYHKPQYYQVLPFDSCLNIGDPSNFSKTIFLKVDAYEDGKALIEWTPFEVMEEMDYYNIYRIIDTIIDTYPIIQISPNADLAYVDNYGGFVSLDAKVGYIVEAVGYFSSIINEQDYARSNPNFLARTSTLFVPTGFNPQRGVNKIFKPIYSGIKIRNYSFKVLNRWGQIIFESNQPVLGWDGKYNNEFVMPGAYVFVVDYETFDGKIAQKSGLFIVL